MESVFLSSCFPNHQGVKKGCQPKGLMSPQEHTLLNPKESYLCADLKCIPGFPPCFLFSRAARVGSWFEVLSWQFFPRQLMEQAGRACCLFKGSNATLGGPGPFGKQNMRVAPLAQSLQDEDRAGTDAISPAMLLRPWGLVKADGSSCWLWLLYHTGCRRMGYLDSFYNHCLQKYFLGCLAVGHSEGILHVELHKWAW